MVIAQVSDVNDPQNHGRVKLTFPWLSDNYVSDWARTVQPGAGKDRGAMVVPEVGDEVLAAFEQGDIRRPYVLGGLLQRRRHPEARDRSTWSTPDRARSTAGRSSPGADTGSTCSTRTGKAEGVTIRTRRRQAAAR